MTHDIGDTGGLPVIEAEPMVAIWTCAFCSHENDASNTDCEKSATHPAPMLTTATLRGQAVPEAFAQTLRSLEGDSRRLDATLIAAREKGWTLQALGDAIGVSRERIRQRTRSGWYFNDLPEIPPLPRHEVRAPTPKPPVRQLMPSAQTAQRLRELNEIARTVNGATAADHPSRAISDRLTLMLHALTEQGVSLSTLGRTLGVTHNAIRSRLARHGFRPLAPYESPYKGKPQPNGTKTHCLRGHPLSGDNLYAPAGGGRHCKTCVAIRGKKYRQSKSEQTGDPRP